MHKEENMEMHFKQHHHMGAITPDIDNSQDC